jgi:hypothetical protein
MRAVWSFWSRPYREGRANAWCKPVHHLLAWGLSLSAARQHYPDTALVTDLEGRKLLVDTLGLQFSSVSTELERLNSADPDWWALGKLMAYSIQDAPFVHIDADVFLWKPLPIGVVNAPVLAQCPEYFGNKSDLGMVEIEQVFTDCGLPLPVEWEWAVSQEDPLLRQSNCGIVGGCHVDFLRYYSRTALDLVLRHPSAEAWARVTHKSNTALEQFFLNACVGFHRHHPESPYRGVHLKYLFPSWEDASNANSATRAGYTHLQFVAKANPAVGRRIEERVKREDPGFFRHCESVAGRMHYT